MPFSANTTDAATRALMTAALHSAWTAFCLARAPSEDDRTAMVAAITDAVAAGERDFMRLQQKALDASGVLPPMKAEDRRKLIRLVTETDDQDDHGGK